MTLNEEYALDQSSAPITLEVTIGYAQRGATELSLDGVPLVIQPPCKPNGVYQESFKITIGNSANLKGKELQIQTIVTRIQPNQPNVSVDVQLKGGTTDSNYVPMSATIDMNGGTQYFLGAIELK